MRNYANISERGKTLTCNGLYNEFSERSVNGNEEVSL